MKISPQLIEWLKREVDTFHNVSMRWDATALEIAMITALQHHALIEIDHVVDGDSQDCIYYRLTASGIEAFNSAASDTAAAIRTELAAANARIAVLEGELDDLYSGKPERLEQLKREVELSRLARKTLEKLRATHSNMADSKYRVRPSTTGASGYDVVSEDDEQVYFRNLPELEARKKADWMNGRAP